MVLYTGKTVEEAIEKGLADLQLPRLKAHIKVISKEKKGFLGFGKKPARVDIEGISEKPVNKVDNQSQATGSAAISKQNEALENTEVGSERDSISSEVEEGASQIKENLEQVMPKTSEGPSLTHKEQSFKEFVASEFPSEDFSKDIEGAAQEVSDYITKVIYEMDIEASLEITYNRRQINLQIETQEAGRVIGYHGKVLKSLQLLAQNFLHDRYSKNFSVSLNVHDYVEHRTETLIDFTQKIAHRVLESHENYTMDPMSNSERKIVHKTISTIEGVESYSEGNDPNRYVVVSLQR
ncbi:protein jag [Streptococcus didelphis]|uniref:RNA-binding protein KhpB n=1 Tax=Streptococcus didelphis TaxID=102886 RepID=A0ABY9LHW7_9STRE|nr:RNA-binding cell elongation regulator Jag/EloR [Streptococcus didelphis]WMB27750.1 protein jag [Streptococcus didelphis]